VSTPAIRIAYAGLGAGSTPLWVAQDAGYFARQGLTVELLHFRGSQALARAVLDDDIRFANLAAPSVVAANLSIPGADAVYLTGGINWLIQKLVTRPEIDSVDKLRGRTLGTGHPGDLEDRLLRLLLAECSLELGSDVQTRLTDGQPDAIAQLDSGQIDGALFTPPYVFQATARGYRVLIDAAARRHEYQLGGLVARRSFVDVHPDLTRGVLRAYVEAIHHLKTEREFAAQVMRRYSGLDDAAIARQAVDALAEVLQPAPYPSLLGLQRILDDLAEQMPAARGVDPATQTDPRWVRELDESGVIRELYAAASSSDRPGRPD
jgi:NitT/TauT family transport system substrate-binding protein